MRNSAARRLCLAGVVLVTMSGCAPGGDLPLLQDADVDHVYRLSSNDQVRVITYGEQQLSGDFGIDEGGFIALPLLGAVHADGMTTTQLAHEIEDTMRAKKLFADPSVVVEVTRYRPVYVLGEVQHPGPFPFQTHMTFLQAVALAGGFTPRAVKDRAEVIRATPAGTAQGRLEPTSGVDPGDVITVLERNF